MTIQEAINTAGAGGYHLHGSDGVATIYSGANSEYSAWTRTDNHSSFMVAVHETFLDPAFWQALGRALGWEAACELAISCVHGHEECRHCHGYYWMYQWHCFIQQMAQGHPPDAFFASLPHAASHEMWLRKVLFVPLCPPCADHPHHIQRGTPWCGVALPHVQP